MSERPSAPRFLSQFTRSQRPSEPLDDQPRTSISPASSIRITVSATASDVSAHRDHHGDSAGSHPGILATTAPILSPSTGASGDDVTKQSTSFRDRIFGRLKKSPSPDPNRLNQSTNVDLDHPMLTTPAQTSTNDPWPSLSPLPTEATTDSSRVIPSAEGEASDARSSVPAAPSGPAAPRRSDGDPKKMIIGSTKALLRTAATALRLVPIPNLDQIPNALLTGIQIYENVSGNTQDLKQLCEVIQQAGKSVFEPLQTWTGKIPPELETLVEEFHVALQIQVEDIKLVQEKNIVEKTIQTSNITQQITNMKNCLNDAIRRFELRSLTLIVLRTEHASVQSEISRLKRAPAEHIYVKSKSECLPGTRLKIQESILEHLKKPENRFVWLRGSPGTGKTAISMSIASTLEQQGALAASYFWDKNRRGSGLDSIEQFPSTLACQLASLNEDFKLSLVRQLRKPDLALFQELPLEKQIKTLVIEPIRNLKDIFPSGTDRFVIVLDGLDECGNQETLESLMGLVLGLQELPQAFSVLVSCRPEPGVISAWFEAQHEGLVIPCEDVDKIEYDEDFHTICCIVEDGLRDVIRKSSWKPTEWELNDFAWACRGLPVMASIRVRDVCQRTRRGRTLQSAFQGLRSVTGTPTDLNQEYLRILRQAYVVDSAGIPPDISKMYRLVVTAILTAYGLRDVSSMSQMFGFSEDEIRATLEPISSIINLPLDNAEDITFYHATAREFITGKPIGDEKDKVFFIDDVNGYLLGLPLLRYFNNCCEQNVFGIPTDPRSLGEEGKWEEFMVKKKDYRSRFDYVIYHLADHLDPLQLFSQESNELQNEFNSFITRNYVLIFAHLQSHMEETWHGEIFPEQLLQFNNHDSIQLLRDLHQVTQHAEDHPWRFYRSILPFAPPSVYKQYGHLSGVRVFSIHGKSDDTIPLNEDSCRAQEVMHAKLTERVRQWGQEISYKAEFYQPDIRNGVVTCAALSLDGRYVVLGFGSGVIEVVDIDHQRPICQLQHNPANLPNWIEFVYGSHRVATEDIDGNVTVLSHGIAPVKLGNLPSGLYPAETAISDNGLFIIRAPRNFDNPWCDNMTLIAVSEYPFIRLLTSPSDLSVPFPSSPSTQYRNATPLSRPHRRTLGFSPGARYVGAFDGFSAFTWSTQSYELIASYRVTNPFFWIINPNVPPTPFHLVPNPIFTQATPLLVEDDTAYEHRSEDAGCDSEDESWIKRPFYDLSPSSHRVWEAESTSSATRENPHIWCRSVMLNGRQILELPEEYEPVTSLLAWYGHRVPECSLESYRPQSSRDGTRFLVQGKSKTPIVIDISRVV